MKEDEKKSGERDEELVRRAQSGDKQATEALLVRFAGVVRGRARGFFLIGGETEDLIQEGMFQKFCVSLHFPSDNRRGEGLGEKEKRAFE